MLNTRFLVMHRLLALWLALALAWPSPAVALRPRAGGLEERTAVTQDLAQRLAPASHAAGLEERSRTVLGAVDATAWTQLQDFAGRMRAQGRRWDESVRIAGVLTDADWTILSPDTNNVVTASIARDLAWVLDHAGVVRVVTASSPEMMRDRVEAAVRARLKVFKSVERLGVFARAGGVLASYPDDARVVRPAGRVLTEPQQIALLTACAEAVLEAIAAARPVPAINDLREALPNAKTVQDVVTLIENAEHRTGLVRPHDVIVHWDREFPTMLLVTFADRQLDAKALLDAIQPKVAAQFPIGPPLYVSYGPHYVAAGLFRKPETVVADLAGGAYEPSRNPGVILLAGDGVLDDLEAMREATRRVSNLLMLPYFVGDSSVVQSDEAIIVPARETFVKATEAFLSRLVSAAEFGESYAAMPLLRGRYAVQELADALGMGLDDFLTKTLPQPFSAFEQARTARLAAAGLEEAAERAMARFDAWTRSRLEGRADASTARAVADDIATMLGRTGADAAHWRRMLQWRLEVTPPPPDGDLTDGSFRRKTVKIRSLLFNPPFTDDDVMRHLISLQQSPIFPEDAWHLDRWITGHPAALAAEAWIYGSFLGYLTPISDVDAWLPPGRPAAWHVLHIDKRESLGAVALNWGTPLLIPLKRDYLDHRLALQARDLFVRTEGTWRVNGARLAELYRRHQAIRDQLREAADPAVSEDVLARRATIQLQQALDAVAAAGMEEAPADPGDPAVPMPDPATATAADVADYLTRRWGVQVLEEGKDRFVVDQREIPEAFWTCHAIRPHEPGRIPVNFQLWPEEVVIDTATMPTSELVYPLDVLPSFEGGESFTNVYLGFVRGVPYPVVIKHFYMGFNAREVAWAKVFDHQGIGPRVSSLVESSYVMQAVPGQQVVRDVRDAPRELLSRYPDVPLLMTRAEEAGMTPASIVQTKSGGLTTIDASNAHLENPEQLNRWILAQNAGWAIHELGVKSVTPTGKGYVLSNQAALAALALLKLPPESGLPVVAVATPVQAERLRAIARQGGFADRLDTWERDYLVTARADTPDALQAARVEAEAMLARRPGVTDPDFVFVDTLSETEQEFGPAFLRLLSDLGLTLREGWYAEALDDLYRAAQA